MDQKKSQKGLFNFFKKKKTPPKARTLKQSQLFGKSKFMII